MALNTEQIIKIKDTFPSLGAKKINQIQNIVKGSPKPKPQIQMTTKGLSRKQVIIPMNGDNIAKFMKESLLHVSNINRALKNAKTEILVDFIRSDQANITVVTNKVAFSSDLVIIEKYIKNVDCIDVSDVQIPCLPQSKSYFKIIDILYYPHSNSQVCLAFSDVENIIKQNQIFNNIVLASKLQVIKVFPKLDMSIVWVDIWDIQSGSKAKGLINQCFNVRRYITTIRGANMNPGIPQCKYYWKCGHTTYLFLQNPRSEVHEMQ